jgi:SPP1 gp7 family putative phage head morphogenesis protein
MRLLRRWPFVTFDDKEKVDASALARARRGHSVALRQKEERAVSRQVRGFRAGEKRILSRIERLAKKLIAAEAAGLPISPAAIHQEARYWELLATIREELGALGEATVSEVQRLQEEALALAIRQAVQRLEQYVPDRSFIRLPKEALSHLVGNLSDGSPLRDTLDSLPRVGVDRAAQILQAGLQEGIGTREIARQLKREVVDDPKRRCLTIARTEVNRVHRSALIESYRANSHVCSGWVWRSSRDARTCPICLAMDGRRFKFSDPFATHPVCRCSPDPVVSYLDDEEETDTGEAWLRRQPEERQLEALGPSRLALWRAGKPLHEMVEVVPNDRWGPGRKLTPLRLLRSPSGAAPAPAAPSRVSPPAQPSLPVAPMQPARLSPNANARAKELFGEPVDVAVSPEAKGKIEEYFGEPLSANQLADIVGALGGSQVSVTWGYSRTAKMNVIQAVVKHPLLRQQRRTIRRNRKGEVYIHNEELVLTPEAKGQGLGPMLFQKQVEACRQLARVRWIETWGARLMGFPDGYKLWPKMGYNQVLPVAVRSRVPASIGQPKTIQDLISTPEGMEWWVVNGTDLKNLKFTLSEKSLSMKIHNKQMERFNVNFAVEDPGEKEGAEVGLSPLEHARAVQEWMLEHEPARLNRLHPVGSPRRLV